MGRETQCREGIHTGFLFARPDLFIELTTMKQSPSPKESEGTVARRALSRREHQDFLSGITRI
jgi:hypothetical protein